MSKILIITLEYPPQIGGIASYVYNFATHLPAEDVVVYAPLMNGCDKIDADSGRITYRKSPFFKWFWPRWIKMLWQVRGIVKKEKIDVIYVHHVLPVGYIARLIKFFWHKKYVVFMHGSDVGEATRSWWKRLMLRMVLNSASNIVVNSEFLKNKLLSRVPGYKNITVIYPCPGDGFFKEPNIDQLNKLKSHLAIDGKRVLLTVARLSGGKGVPLLARCFSKILAKVPNLVWVVVGDGSKKSEVEAIAVQENFSSVLRLVGNVPYAELPLYFRVADVCALLTHPDEGKEEGLGTVFIEAAATGLPVVAGRVGGVEEAVINGVTGTVVEPYQEQVVIDAICELFLNKDLARKYSDATKQRALAEFRWEKQISKLISL